MVVDVVVPAAGESVSEGILAAWSQTDGAFVRESETLFELETDKATLDVPAPASGTLTIGVQAGDGVEVGQRVATIKVGSAPAADGTDSDDGAKTASATQAADATQDAAVGSGQPLSPAVRHLVAEHNLNPQQIAGSGKQGRITKADVMAAVEQQTEQKPTPPIATPMATATMPVAVPQASEQRQRRQKMSLLRKRIAENLIMSKQNAAHLTTFNEIDMSKIIELRRLYRDSFEQRHGVRLGFMSFFVKAACQALQRYPAANAFIDGDEIVFNDYWNLGVALSGDRGLIVPVIRDVDRKSFAEIEAKIVDFATRSKERRIMPDELVGGTFTITNGGIFGSLLSTPIPNPPQTAILGMHTIQQRPVVVDGQIVARPMMYAALTYDHRVIDGRDAVGLLATIKALAEEPARLMLEL